MKVSIHQPCYIPYPGTFYKIWESDTFVFLDNAQYTDGHPMNWNVLVGGNGVFRLTVPVHKTLGESLYDISISDDGKWKKKHLKSIYQNYCKAPYFNDVYEIMERNLNDNEGKLHSLNEGIILDFLKYFGIDTEIKYASDLSVKSSSTQRIIDIVKSVGGDTYVSGNGGKAYQDERAIIDSGINLLYTTYKPIKYCHFKGNHIDNLSIVDYAMNCGPNIIEVFEEMLNVQ